WLELVVPHGLVQKVAVMYLRRKGGDHLVPCSVLIPLRVAGIDQVPVAVAASYDGQAAGRAQRGHTSRHESFHPFVLLCPAAFCPKRCLEPSISRFHPFHEM